MTARSREVNTCLKWVSKTVTSYFFYCTHWPVIVYHFFLFSFRLFCFFFFWGLLNERQVWHSNSTNAKGISSNTGSSFQWAFLSWPRHSVVPLAKTENCCQQSKAHGKEINWNRYSSWLWLSSALWFWKDTFLKPQNFLWMRYELSNYCALF